MIFCHKSAMVDPLSGRPNLLNEDCCLPAAVIKAHALENNLFWMQRYADARGVSLAPHGKTSMTPWLFRRQQQAGAWGIGVGSAWQAQAALAGGIKNVLMANQLVGKANMSLISCLKTAYPSANYFCLVDNLNNAKTLSAFFCARQQTLDVLIELGVAGGRCGCRTVEEACALAASVSRLPGLRLRGLELYEGILHNSNAQRQIEQLLSSAASLACQIEKYVNGEFILTAGGSVWYDVVCNVWLAAKKPDRCRIVIRPGCYITLDHGIYQQAQNALVARDPVARSFRDNLIPALELIAIVQSVPQPSLAVANFGKRDAAFDAGLPQPVAHYREGKVLPLQPHSIVSTDIMDQHCILHLPSDKRLQVGDILIFGTSHPCLTFDKWKTLLLVDESYNVLESLDTQF